MSHQDPTSHTAPSAHHQALEQTPDRLLAPAALAGIGFRPNCTWTPRASIFTALLWAWSDERALTDRFVTVPKLVVWMVRLTREPAATTQAFLKGLKSGTAALALVLVTAFRHRIRQDLEERFLIGGCAIFAIDGSRLELPHTESHERRFAPAAARRRRPMRRVRARTKAARARQKKTNGAQMWLTTRWHVGTGLPRDWRLGPSDGSEREHLKQMIVALPAGALVTADAGVVGYEYGKELRDGGRRLLIRRSGRRTC